MQRRRGPWLRLLAVAAATGAALPLALVAQTATAAPPASVPPPTDPAIARLLAGLPELGTSTQLADRRTVVLGDRLYELGSADGQYPASGFHTRGEMGGYWSQPIKLLDGIWFGADGEWLGPATSTVSGWGYVRSELPNRGGLAASRIDFVPDGQRAGLVGITLTAKTSRTVQLSVDAHSELMGVYPWGETKPSQTTQNLPDTGSFDGTSLVFRDTGTPPNPNALAHDWSAVVGSSRQPSDYKLGPDFRGPQDPAVICPASGPGVPPAPPRCDDTAYGKGTGGQLTYQVALPKHSPVTLWFAVSGSDQSLGEAMAAQRTVLSNPLGALARKVAARKAANRFSDVDLPGDPLLARSVAWSKQNLADSVQESRDLKLRVTNAGTQYPAPVADLASARWIGAGWPDYPWLFGTDGEYSAFAAVAAGQFDPIKAHLRSLHAVSDAVNDHSGKVVHEVVPDGSVYFGANSDPGNTDETAKFPSAVALVWRWTGDDAFRDEMYDFTVRNLRYIFDNLDADGDGWPEGLGNVERNGMGEEKLDNAVYTVRGLRDLADMAASKGDIATSSWAAGKAASMESKFEDAWWFGPTADQYADSLANPDNTKVFQRHWIGLTPTDAVLVRPGQPDHPLASDERANLVLDKREEACYSDEFGLYHTGTGATTATTGNPGPTCDTAVSSVGSERVIFSLNTSIMAVSEGNYGRLGADQQQRYTTANARIQLDPSVWEMPGAMPEIAPSPDFGSNIERTFYERSSVLQAWGTYGILWPVINQQLGVAPDLGRDHVSVVPKIPDGQNRIAGKSIRLGEGSIDVSASRNGKRLVTTVDRRVRTTLTIGAVLPKGATVAGVTVDGGHPQFQLISTARGTEVVVNLTAAGGSTKLVVKLR